MVQNRLSQWPHFQIDGLSVGVQFGLVHVQTIAPGIAAKCHERFGCLDDLGHAGVIVRVALVNVE